MTPGREPNHNASACMSVMRSELRTSAPSCPWRAAESPLVQDAIAVRAMRRAKMPVAGISQRLTDAVAAYQSAIDSASEARRVYEDACRKSGAK